MYFPTLLLTLIAAASSASATLTADQKSALAAHNAARADVGVDALVWDADLFADAKAWAEGLAADGVLEHDSSLGDIGECLYSGGSGSGQLTDATAAWVSEKSLYTPGEVITMDNYEGFGHYTQVVWSDTTKVGIASAEDANGVVYVVARYSPSGNYMGETPY